MTNKEPKFDMYTQTFLPQVEELGEEGMQQFAHAQKLLDEEYLTWTLKD